MGPNFCLTPLSSSVSSYREEREYVITAAARLYGGKIFKIIIKKIRGRFIDFDTDLLVQV